MYSLSDVCSFDGELLLCINVNYHTKRLYRLEKQYFVDATNKRAGVERSTDFFYDDPVKMLKMFETK